MNPIERTAAKLLVAATLTAMLIGAPFRRCRAEEGREHGPPGTASSTALDSAATALFATALDPLASSALRITPPAHPAILNIAPHGVELRHALVERSVAHSMWGVREHFSFHATPLDHEERQRQQVAIHLGRAVSAPGDAATAGRIEAIYRSLRVAHWGHHANGLLGGHFNFDYSAVHCVDLDRALPHGRYGRFASLHFHHDEERVHVDAANPFGMAGLLVPVHFFLDVVAGHLPWHSSQPMRQASLNEAPRGIGQ